MTPISDKKTAIVYHYAAHYRLGIFQELMNTKGTEYSLICDTEAEHNIKTIDITYSKLPYTKGGIRWFFVKNKTFIKNKFLWQKGLISILRKNKYDNVIFLGNIYYISTWVSILYLKLKSTRTYFWTHGVTSNEKGIKWKLRKLFYSMGDGVMLYGENAKKVMVNNGFNEKKLHVIYNSLDYNTQLINRKSISTNIIEKTRSQLFKNPDLPILFFVGRLTHYKKLNMIIDVSKRLSNKNLKTNVLFIGEGEAKDSLVKAAKTYNLEENVKFYGACYDENELCKLVSASDLCISPGEVGLTAITSLGYGTPVISHNDFNHQMPEYEAISPGINGDLFERDSLDDLENKIQNWIFKSKKISRDKIRSNCYQIIDEKYNPKYQAITINNIIHKQ